MNNEKRLTPDADAYPEMAGEYSGTGEAADAGAQALGSLAVRAAIEQLGGSASDPLRPEELSRSWLRHPSLSREQERALFRVYHTYRDADGKPITDTPAWRLLEDEQFIQALTSARPGAEAESAHEKRQWLRIMTTAETIEDVIIACFQRRVADKTDAYNGPYAPFMDKVAGANERLVDAVRGFDPKKGYRFSTYADKYILSGIQQAVADYHGVDRSTIVNMSTVYYFTAGFREVFQREPSRADLERQLHANAYDDDGRPLMSVPAIMRVLDFMYGPALRSQSLSHKHPSGIRSPEEGLSSPESAADDEADAVQEQMQDLDAIERQLVRARFEFGDSPMGYDETLRALGLSEDKAESILTAALDKMSAVLRVQGLARHRTGTKEPAAKPSGPTDDEADPNTPEGFSSDQTDSMSDQEFDEVLSAMPHAPQKVKFLAEQGWSRERIQRKLAISRSLMHLTIKTLRQRDEAWVPPYGEKGVERQQRLDEVGRLIQSGATASEISSAMKLSRTAVDSMARELGMSIRRVKVDTAALRVAARNEETERLRVWLVEHPRFNRTREQIDPTEETGF